MFFILFSRLCLCVFPLAAKLRDPFVWLSSNQMESQQYDISIFINNGAAAAETPAQHSPQYHNDNDNTNNTNNFYIAIDSDIDALLIQYKRNNIGFPFPHPLRSVVYSCQWIHSHMPSTRVICGDFFSSRLRFFA